MKTSKNYLVGLALAVSFLVATNVRADFISIYQDKNRYMSTVGPSDWAFGAFQQVGNNFSPRVWDFTMSNTLTGEMGAGILTMSNFNGAGGLMQEPQAGANGTLSLWHNSANKLDLAFTFNFGDEKSFIDSFYLGIVPHSSWSAAERFLVTADYWLDGVMYTTDAITLDKDNTFFGIVLDPGAFLAEINFWSTGTPNNGYKMMDIGFGGTFGGGDDSAVVPEPATLAMLGLGLAGLGIARQRMKK